MVSLSAAHRPSWLAMHTPGPRLLQSVSLAQTPQVLLLPHTGVLSGQSLFTTHCTQAPLAIAQTGEVGVSMLQSVGPGAFTQDTHVPVSEQNGFVDVLQSLSTPHSRQAPLAPHTACLPLVRVAHAVAVGEGSLAVHDSQAPALQKGFPAVVQSLSARHSTHVPPSASHMGAPDVIHALVLPLHPTQTCASPQNDFALSVHDVSSPKHSTQVWVSVSQAGVGLKQSLLPTHGTHTFLTRSQAGVPIMPAQSVVASQ